MWPFITDEQREAVDAFARFCRNVLQPVLKRHEAAPAVPRDVLQDLLRRVVPFGLGSGRVRTEHGGMALDPVTAGLLLETAVELAYEVALPAFINESVALSLAGNGGDALKRSYLEPLVAGERIAASGNTEPSGGSDVSAVTTRAVRTKHGYALTGRKAFITNGQYADFVLVLARSTETGKLDLYLVDREAHGYDVTPLQTMGAIHTAELAFDHVEVPEDHRLRTDGKGLGVTLAAFQAARAYVALYCTGIANAAQAAALAYAGERTQFGGPIAGKQLVQAHLADNQVDIDAARLLAYRALELASRGVPCAVEASMAKLFASEAAQRVADRALQIHGAYGTTPQFPVEKLYRTVRVGRIVEGTSEVQRLVIGKALTGISAF